MTDKSPNISEARVAAAKCVRCGQPVAPRFRPFCSQRCRDIDLSAWLRGAYRVATDEAPDLEADPKSPVDKSQTGS